jgi:organic hydroperoxide reductase OsmC/OhrA
MQIRADVQSREGSYDVGLATDGVAKSLTVAPKSSGFGSAINGGELLFLALATCYCNDIYREAAREGIIVDQVAVTVEGEFHGIGAPATNVRYHARVAARASEEAILALMRHTDTVAEIQNTLRVLTPVVLVTTAATSL